MALNSLVISFVRSNEFGDLSSVKKIKENNGAYSNTVTKKVTHLVCSGPDYRESEKYKKAKRLGIPCVTEKWLDVAISSGKKNKELPKESDYDPEKQPTANDSIDYDLDDVAPKVTKPKKAGISKVTVSSPVSSPTKKKEVTEVIDNALHGWCIYISGKHTKSHNELRKLIESHGGVVSLAITDKVTHYLGGGDKADILSSYGATGIDEEYLDQAIVIGNEPQKIPIMSPSPVKKSVGGSKKIERIVRRKLIRGGYFYEVQYRGMEEEENELLSADDVIKIGGQNILRAFDHKYNQEMKSVFNFASFTRETNEDGLFPVTSPKKEKKPKNPDSTGKRGRPKKDGSSSPKKESPKKTTPKKTTPKKQVKSTTPKKSKPPTPKKAVVLTTDDESMEEDNVVIEKKKNTKKVTPTKATVKTTPKKTVLDKEEGTTKVKNSPKRKQVTPVKKQTNKKVKEVASSNEKGKKGQQQTKTTEETPKKKPGRPKRTADTNAVTETVPKNKKKKTA